jgi:DNA-binding CsgD family transcriptional regulator
VRSAIAIGEQRLVDAADDAHAALEIAFADMLTPEIALCLDVLAAVLGAHHDWKRLARVYGGAERLRDESDVRWELETFARQRDKALVAARQALGPATFETEHARGRTLALDDLVAYVRRGRGSRGRPTYDWESLTSTERLVVDLVAAGRTNPEIAAQLLISPNTVKSHLAHVFAKLGVRTRTELATLKHRTERASP